MTKVKRSTSQITLTATFVVAGALTLGAFGWLTEQRSVLGTGEQVQPSQGGDQESGNHDHADHDHPSALNGNGRFTGSDGQWPPQPVEATNLVTRRLGESSGRALEARIAEAEEATPSLLDDEQDSRGRRSDTVPQTPSEVLLSDPSVIEALGSDFKLVGIEDNPQDQKGNRNGNATATALVYFSPETANTVRATVVGSRISDLNIESADVFQPPLDQAESDEAVALARQHWRENGESNIDDLEGYSILAFAPDGSFYDERMAFVSFHPALDSAPELVTWVNLTDSTILKAEVDR